MGRPYKDLSGRKFGRLRVLTEAGRDGDGSVLWKCLCDCGQTPLVRGTNLLHKRVVSCGCHRKDRRGKRNPNYKTGRTKTKDGYVLLSGHQGHPRASKSGHVAEHVIVMELRLGRYLKGKETVHHKNGKRDDNADGNLELWCSSHPPGQRIEDLVSWANDIIAEYGSLISSGK